MLKNKFFLGCRCCVPWQAGWFRKAHHGRGLPSANKTGLLGTSPTRFSLQLNLHKGKGAGHPPTCSVRASQSPCSPPYRQCWLGLSADRQEEVKAATLLLLVIKSDPLVPFAIWKKRQIVKCS